MNRFAENQGRSIHRAGFLRPSITVVILLGIVTLSLSLSPSPVRGAMFFVSTTGDDSWSGQLPDPSDQNGPFATLARARDAVRDHIMQSGLTESVSVVIRGGTYHLNNTLVLDSRDSGTQQHRITWSAFENEKTVISGGKPITGWTTYQGKIQTAPPIHCALPGSHFPCR